MIQRRQTLYLLAAFVLTVVCMLFPVGRFATQGGIIDMTNLSLIDQDGNTSYQPWALMGILAISAIIEFMAIFLFRRRAVQMRFCNFAITLQIGWYAVYGFFAWSLGAEMVATFRPTLWAAIPAANMILLYMAFRGVLHDEMLVRSLDRLR